MKKLFFVFMITAGIISCQPKEKDIKQTEDMSEITGEKWSGFSKIEPTAISENAIQLIGKEWMLITAGDESAFNTMTASWGCLGEIWSKPVSMITVRDSRYTYEFLQKGDYYSLSFFSKDYRNTLATLGSKSGRDTDKIKESGLTPVVTPTGTMSFKEAKLVIECKKLYAEPFKEESFIDKETFEKIYVKGDPSMHTFYIGEIVNVWIK